MIKNVTIRTRLVLLVIFMSLLLVGIGLTGLQNASESNMALSSVYRNNVVPLKQLKIMSDMYIVRIVRSVNRMIIGQISPREAIDGLDAASQTIHEQWQGYLKTVNQPEEQQLVAEFEPMMSKSEESLQGVRVLLEKGDREQLSKFPIYSVTDPISDKIAELMDLQLRIAKADYEKALQNYAGKRTLALALIIAGIVLSAGISWTIIRDITGSLNRVTQELRGLSAGEADLTKRIPIRGQDEVGVLAGCFNDLMQKLLTLVRRVQESGVQVTSSSTQIAASSRELEATMTEQVASTNQVVASAKEISSTSQELVRTMNEVAQMSGKAAASADSGRGGLGRLESSMTQMEEAARMISDKLAVIHDKAANITNVVTTITKVAEQTNLLSLNAAIEAEKAGEYGLGFGVVAREIRRLADQTAVSTLEIERTVKEMKAAVSAGVMSMDKFSDQVRSGVGESRKAGGQLGEIIEQVHSLTPRFESVNQGMQSQSQVAQQISDAMVQLSEAAGQTAGSLKETNRAIQHLNEAAKTLQREFSLFKVS